jgi:hypothetical protein
MQLCVEEQFFAISQTYFLYIFSTFFTFFTKKICKYQNNSLLLHILKVVYPAGTQVKSLKFNNGDFSMPAFSPFHKKGGNISYYEYICN